MHTRFDTQSPHTNQIVCTRCLFAFKNTAAYNKHKEGCLQFCRSCGAVVGRKSHKCRAGTKRKHERDRRFLKGRDMWEVRWGTP